MGITEPLGSNSADLKRVLPEHIEVMWETICHIMDEHPGGMLDWFHRDSLLASIKRDGIDCWVGVENGRVDMAGFSLIERYKNFSRLQFMWGGGKNFKKYWAIGAERLEQWAAVHQCKDIYVMGHPGLEWLLRDLGYKQKEVVLSKDVTWRWRH